MSCITNKYETKIYVSDKWPIYPTFSLNLVYVCKVYLRNTLQKTFPWPFKVTVMSLLTS